MYRLLLLLLLLGLAAFAGFGRAGAADAPVTIVVRPGDSTADIGQLVESLRKRNQPVVVRVEGTAAKDAGKSAAAPTASASASIWSGGGQPAAAMVGQEAGHAMRRQFRDEAHAFSQIPVVLAEVGATWSTVHDGAPWSAALLAASVLAGAIGAAVLVHAWLRKTVRQWLRCGNRRFSNKLGAVAAYAAIDAAALLAAFAAGQALLVALLPKNDVVQVLAVDLLEWFMVVGVYWGIGRLLLSPQAPANRLMPLPNAERHFRLFTIYGLIGFTITFIAHFVARASTNKSGVLGLILLVGTLVTIYKIWWFWTGRRDITQAVLVSGPECAEKSLVRRVGAVLLPYILMAVAVLILATSHLSVNSPQLVDLGKAAGLTQILAILLPALAGGIDAVTRDFATDRDGVERGPWRKSAALAARAFLLATLWIGGFYVVLRTWSVFFVDMDSGMIVAAIQTFGLAAAILVLGLTTLVFLRTAFDTYQRVHHRVQMPGGDDDTPAIESRLGTVLPLLRGLILGAVVALTALVALAYIGVNISPLLAGAGVIGLAISFGSQALIRDIVSGIFFMADDAFRVGEYIDTGRLKGTVEKITLRSAQLRHQNGQVHTIPFGQLHAVTNFSRDWATVKFNIRIEHGSDLEKARKVIKKVGLDLLEDPELGNDFILPLKLQGVADITDTALIVRLKFTAKPIRPSWLQREAMKRIYGALRAAGIEFASGAVTVRSRSGDVTEHAAAVQSQPAEAALVPKIAAQ